MWNSINIPDFDDEDVIALKDTLVKFKKFKSIMEYGVGVSNLNTSFIRGFTDMKINIDIKKHNPNHQTMLDQIFISEDGVDVEILKLKDPHWQKGKIRMKLVVEFIPDEPEEVQAESPLDDIRQAQISKPEN